MLDLPFKILPPAALAGLLLYAAVTALWTQPLVERRLTEKVYLPQCTADLAMAKAGGQQLADAERQQKLTLLNALRNSPWAQLPGVRETIRMLELALEPELALPPSQAAERGSPCGCAVSLAFDGIRLPMLLHVMTARLYQPAELQALPARIARHLDQDCSP